MDNIVKAPFGLYIMFLRFVKNNMIMTRLKAEFEYVFVLVGNAKASDPLSLAGQTTDGLSDGDCLCPGEAATIVGLNSWHCHVNGG